MSYKIHALSWEFDHISVFIIVLVENIKPCSAGNNSLLW